MKDKFKKSIERYCILHAISRDFYILWNSEYLLVTQKGSDGTKFLPVCQIGNNYLKVVTLTRWFPYTQWRRPQSIFDAKPRISIGMVSINFQNYQSYSYIF